MRSVIGEKRRGEIKSKWIYEIRGWRGWPRNIGKAARGYCKSDSDHRESHKMDLKREGAFRAGRGGEAEVVRTRRSYTSAKRR